MMLEDYVLKNKKVMELIKSQPTSDTTATMYYCTLDYATARFNTALLKLSQDRLLDQKLKSDVHECFKIIQDFYKNVQRYKQWPSITKPFIKLVLHRIGTKRIPKIKQLLSRVENSNHYYHFGDDTV